MNGTIIKAQIPYRFEALGGYLHTRYNTPSEAYCSGSPTGFCQTSGSCSKVVACTHSNRTAKSGWLAEVEENGSGYHSSLGFMSLDWFCKPAACAKILRQVSDPCPSCTNGFLSPGSTVAVSASNPKLQCLDRVFVDGVGTVIVTDNGGGLQLNQLDHYAGTSGCNRSAGTIGTRATFKLY